LRVPFTGTRGPSPTPEKQPHTIIPPPPNFTLGTCQEAPCNQASTVLLATAKPKHVYRIARQRSVIGHSREHVSSALESSALHLVMEGLDAAAQPWKAIP
ncbi:unnamed protein product, partial [Staurois parvus]